MFQKMVIFWTLSGRAGQGRFERKCLNRKNLRQNTTFGIQVASNISEGGRKEINMKKRGQTKTRRYSLGDLIAALFDESRKISSDRLEQKLIVYAALRDLLKRRIHTLHPVALRLRA